MKKLLLIGVLLVIAFSPMPVQSDSDTKDFDLIPCGGFEFDKDGQHITRVLEDPVPEGWQKISATEMAKTEPPCSLCHLFKLGENVINFFLFPSNLNGHAPIIPLVAGLLFAVGGLYILFGAGNPTLHEKGKKTLTSVVIGLLIVYTAWIFMNTFLTFLGVASWTGLGSWWEITCGI